MKKLLKWLGFGILIILILAVAITTYAYFRIESGQNKMYSIPDETVALTTDSTALIEGKRIATYRGCNDCHTPDLSGKVFIEDGILGFVYAPNISKGGVTKDYSVADWLRVIRHGVAKNGKSVRIMPSEDYQNMSDEEASLLISYLESAPAIHKESKPTQFALPIRLLAMLDNTIQPFSAEKIDHNTKRTLRPKAEVSLELGKYMASNCSGCHGNGFSGGIIPGMPPEYPPAANLTKAGNLKDWTEAQFVQTIRTGIRPNGKALDPSVMPYKAFGAMTDIELKAIWMYLQSLPAKPTGGR